MEYVDHQTASVTGPGRHTASLSDSRGWSFGTVVTTLCYATTVLVVLAWSVGLSVWLAALLPLAILAAIAVARLLPRVLIAVFVVQGLRRQSRHSARPRRAPPRRQT